MLYQIENGTVSLGGKTIFDHINFSVKGNEKIGIVGRNGAGKTTLLRLLSGEITLDRDDRDFGPGIRKEGNISVGYLTQHSFDNPEKTVEEEILSCFSEEDLFQKERYDYEQEYDRIFVGFGFSREEKGKKLREFSGGEQTKIALIKLLLSKPDLLLLDEPTNHLDMDCVEWLEEYLSTYEKAVVMVSHDRFFLDRTAEIIYELSGGKLTRYVGNYTSYRKQKEKNLEILKKKYDAQQKEIARLTELIERFKHKPKKASMARSKKKVLERMVKIEKPEEEESFTFKDKINPESAGPKNVLETDHLVIGYDVPVKELTFRLRRGQKVAILGPNGAGKTTFLKTIIGQIPPLSGTFFFGNGVQSGYFDQHSAEIMSEKRVREHFGDCFPKLTEKEKNQILGHYLFPARKAGTKFSDLSGGEKNRLILAELLESRPNLLLLDEPTNHMDLLAKETMESAFRAYSGTILFISHDRYFVNRLADALLIFENDGIKYYPFGYQHYLHMKTKRKNGEQSWTDVVNAENTKLVEGLMNVPEKERHQSPGFNTEQSYTDWQLSLATRQLKITQDQMEKHIAGFSDLSYEEWKKGTWEEEREKRMADYEEACLLWYDKWQEYEEAFDSYQEDL
ncbi:MAG: ABC-F family ATP-binding cassette domain-containing protein [Lachnospiraceae bacterium]|nr:ABC-F family ATP-binding cassette domain-containing protein [Lachnospiraceae bacterium]